MLESHEALVAETFGQEALLELLAGLQVGSYPARVAGRLAGEIVPCILAQDAAQTRPYSTLA